MAHPQHNDIRRRYDYRCGYCGVTEINSAGELTIDHYHPESAGGDDTADNLVYACFRCNNYKSDFWPTAAEVDRGIRILHPLLDTLSLHYIENPADCRLISLTDTGRFHIQVLQLNRPELVAYRQRQRLAMLQAARMELQETQIQELTERLTILEETIRLLRLQQMQPEE